ncbi:TMEM175 family protein [Kitasatospora sp. P5_F3]
MNSARLEAFSDGVFAIAITLLILDIRVPKEGPLLQGLIHEWPAYCAYVVSFLIIGMVWMNHHTMLFYIRKVDRGLLLFNLLLLMNVAFIPFPTHVLAEAMSSGEGGRTAAVFYGLTLTLGGIPFNAIWVYASRGHRHLGNMITPEQAAVMRRHFLMGPVLYLGATLVGLISAVASLTIFGVLLLFYMIEVLSSVGHSQADAQARPPIKTMGAVAEPPTPAPPDAVTASAPAPAPADRAHEQDDTGTAPTPLRKPTPTQANAAPELRAVPIVVPQPGVPVAVGGGERCTNCGRAD